MNLFIDTNVFLSFYHFSSDDLDELSKLAVLVRQQEIVLHVPEQVTMELRRNRAGKIAQALEGLRGQRLNLQFPQLCREYDQYRKLREYQRLYEEHHAELVAEIEGDVETRSLRADVTLDDLFGLGNKLVTTSQIVERARLRCELGNPPGKRASLGDAVNWESLLEGVPKGEDLHFISDDTDFCSALNRDAFDPFLVDEWLEQKAADLFFYKRLSSFFRERFPNISLTDELEKDALIARLSGSDSFRETHQLIAQLSTYSDFTHAQTNDIVSAAVSNNQVSWIVGDRDVKAFLYRVIAGRENQIHAANLQELNELLCEAEGDEISL